MRIFITTSGNPKRFKALPLALSTGLPVTIVMGPHYTDPPEIDTHRRLTELLDHAKTLPGMPEKVDSPIELAWCPIPLGLGLASIAFMREWIEQSLTQRGDWYVTLDDNVSHVTKLPEPYYSEDRLDFDDYPGVKFRQLYETIATGEEVRALWEEMRSELERQKLTFGGFAIETNFFFRKLKWQRWGYVRTQMSVVQNDGLSWLAWPGMMQEDMIRSVRSVCAHGAVLINRYAKPIKQSFEAGGIGSFETRLPHLRHDSAMMIKEWPGLLDYVKGNDYQVTFAKRSQKTIDEWRRAHGYLD